MIGLSPRLPLSLSNQGGYAMLKTIVEATKQNLKMLVLTIPGERVMMPSYGIGIKAFLFENDTNTLRSSLRERINKQVRIYMPHVKITGISFDPPVPDMSGVNVPTNSISMEIKYIIVPLQIQNILSLSLENIT